MRVGQFLSENSEKHSSLSDCIDKKKKKIVEGDIETVGKKCYLLIHYVELFYPLRDVV